MLELQSHQGAVRKVFVLILITMIEKSGNDYDAGA